MSAVRGWIDTQKRKENGSRYRVKSKLLVPLVLLNRRKPEKKKNSLLSLHPLGVRLPSALPHPLHVVVQQQRPRPVVVEIRAPRPDLPDEPPDPPPLVRVQALVLPLLPQEVEQRLPVVAAALGGQGQGEHLAGRGEVRRGDSSGDGR